MVRKVCPPVVTQACICRPGCRLPMYTPQAPGGGALYLRISASDTKISWCPQLLQQKASRRDAADECTVGGVKGMVVKGRKSKLGLPHPGELQNVKSPLRYAFRSAAAVSKGPCSIAAQLRNVCPAPKTVGDCTN